MERMPMDNYDLQVDIAKRIFLEYDQERLIRKFRLEADPQYLYLNYLNTPLPHQQKERGNRRNCRWRMEGVPLLQHGHDRL